LEAMIRVIDRERARSITCLDRMRAEV
jgi:hypothetical protein